MPTGRIELPTPGLQDQCSNHWAMKATTECVLRTLYDCRYLLKIGNTDLKFDFLLIIIIITLNCFNLIRVTHGLAVCGTGDQNRDYQLQTWKTCPTFLDNFREQKRNLKPEPIFCVETLPRCYSDLKVIFQELKKKMLTIWSAGILSLKF